MRHETRPLARRPLRRVALVAPLALALLGIGPSAGEEGEAQPVSGPRPVPHDERYEVDRAGHPLRIVGYALHPVGVILDYLIFRPAHWIGSHEPLRTLVGQKD